MHPATVKLITLEKIEDFLARGWPAGSHEAVTSQANALRRELQAHLVAAYDEVKAQHKEVVVGVFDEKCGGCRTPVSQIALKRLRLELEVSRCEHCGRFLYLAGGHPLSHCRSHQFAGDPSRR
jgi:hypothetical protein